MGDFFKVKALGGSVKAEVIGGATTFLAMSYIIFVNPATLAQAGMDKNALITVTIVGCMVGTLASAFLTNFPLATGPGLGLSAFFTYSLVLGKGIPWQTALGLVFLSSCIYFLLSIGGIRKKIVAAIPTSLQIAVTVGIGLFISFIGLRSMGVISDHPVTLVSLTSFTPKITIAVFSLIVIFVLEAKKIAGSMLIGILLATVLGVIIGDVKIPASLISMPPSMEPTLFKLDILSALKITFIGPIFSFLFVNMFDGIGMLIASSKSLGRVNQKGEINDLGKLMQVDVGTTLFGSLLGTSPLCYFVESTAGIAAGAKTGLASLVTGLLFALTLFFAPVIGMVPSYAIGAPLVMVGVFMFTNVRELDFNNFKTLVPAFLTILLMPITYSISVGLSFGFLSYIFIHLLSGDFKKINGWLLFIGALSILNIITL